MKRLIAAAVAAGLALEMAHAAPLPEARPDDVGFSEQGLARLDDFFAREIAAKRVPGAVVAIARGGKLVHYKAYGRLDPTKGTPMPLDAFFALASMTKPGRLREDRGIVFRSPHSARRCRHCGERQRRTAKTDEAIHASASGAMDCFASLAMTTSSSSAPATSIHID